MTSRYIFFLILGVDVLILLLQTQQISISANEADILYGDFSVLQFLVQLSLKIFGQNDLALRLIMIIFHLLSVILMYELSKEYIKSQRNQLWFILIFVLLPGVVSAAIIVNSAGMVIFGLLLYLLLKKRLSQACLNGVLLSYAFIDIGFAYLFLGLSVYYISAKRYGQFIYMIGLYLLTSFFYGFDAGGYPTGHFLDVIGVYSAIFTPIIFIYLFYALYRVYITSKIDELWYISTTALALSLVLSFRQRVPVEHFAPYLIIALPIAAQLFIHSYRVRLKIYRTRYRLVFIISLGFLILNTLVVFFNKELYSYIDNPKQHFAYKMDVAKALATQLKDKEINCLSTDADMQLRLKFYKIDKCRENILHTVDLETKQKTNVTVRYKNKTLYKANVTNINNI